MQQIDITRIFAFLIRELQFKSGGMLLFDDFVALCHAVPLTKNNRFAYNLGSNIKKRDKAKPVVGREGNMIHRGLVPRNTSTLNFSTYSKMEVHHAQIFISWLIYR
jgi:hypothetical protein